MKQPLYLLLSDEQASDALRQRNGWTGPFKGHFGGWYYQWERGGRMEGPFIDLATAIASAKQDFSITYGGFIRTYSVRETI